MAKHVKYVSVDFEVDSLEEKLNANGFDRALSTLFLWEGVSNYLTADAVDNTLQTIKELSNKSSCLIFTYVHKGVIDGTTYFPEAKRWLHRVEKVGEPWTFGIDPNEINSFFDQRGYQLESDASTSDIGNPLFVSQGRSERASELYRIAFAKVR